MENSNEKYIDTYIEEKKQIQTALLKLLENHEENDSDFQNLIDLIDTQIKEKDCHELQLILFLILTIANNHQRIGNFTDKIFRILKHYSTEIKNSFSNTQIFDIFHNNKHILLFLIEENILTMDEFIINELTKFSPYFSPEILKTKEKSDAENDSQLPEDFLEKRKKGENDDEVCELIRNDMVDDFISHVSKFENLDDYLNRTVSTSNYETHRFLNKHKDTTLIEYSAFFGSIRIFKYLLLQKVKLRPILWLHAIHGQNAEIIHLLEENNVEPSDKTYYECLQESIKCHHNELAQYFHIKVKNEEEKMYEFDRKSDLIDLCYHYYNFSFLPEKYDHKWLFHHFCHYNYFTLVNFLIQSKEIDINIPLYYAVSKNNEDIVDLLLSQSKIEIGQNCFRGCKKTKNIKIPNGIRSIGDNALRECASITNLIIPSSVSSIGNHAFRECSSLVEITIPSSVKSLGYYAFFKCTSLKKIEILGQIKSIDDSTFDGCESLLEINIPSSVEKIGNYVFNKCSQLKKVTIPEKVSEIGFCVFKNCSSLEVVTIKVPQLEIYDSVFDNCDNLKKLVVSNSFNTSQLSFSHKIQIERF